MAAGEADVVVTDGFTGNVMLKTAEGTAKLCSHYLRTALRSSLGGLMAGILARPTFQTLREKLDPRKHNGAILLGLNGVTVKSHGGTDALGFAHSIDGWRSKIWCVATLISTSLRPSRRLEKLHLPSGIRARE